MKDIKGYEGLYAVTENGEVWSYKTNKFLKASDNGFGYLFVCLCNNGKSKKYKVHRLVAEAYIDNPDNLPAIDHINR
jgi:hypothetical protein